MNINIDTYVSTIFKVYTTDVCVCVHTCIVLEIHRTTGHIQEQQQSAGADPEVSGGLSGAEETALLAILLSLQR